MNKSLPSLAIFFSAPIIIKITPFGKEFAMMIPHCHGVDDIVAQGYHLRVRTTKPELRFVQSPGLKNTPQSTKKARHHGQSPAVISRSAQT